ncbi:16365_t:CDS:2 [Cetraspora pellucida]|uniref:16365_t:CDS:1 n=1 Tax=Cetraspora pellucida TaxID=1433469 RepID=A0A9N9GJ39_9GLOM|nr:16365_t:CDS:2 [Cetraspora pellucida]
MCWRYYLCKKEFSKPYALSQHISQKHPRMFENTSTLKSTSCQSYVLDDNIWNMPKVPNDDTIWNIPEDPNDDTIWNMPKSQEMSQTIEPDLFDPELSLNQLDYSEDASFLSSYS